MSGDGYGTPIRLHFDGGLFGGDSSFPPMELMALSLALSVERKVGGMSMPFTGGARMGLDLNMVNSTIVIEGIFVDDDVNRRVTAASTATASIDFAVEQRDNKTIGAFQHVDIRRFSQMDEIKFNDNGVDRVVNYAFTSDAGDGNYSNTGVTNVVTTNGKTTIHMKSDFSITPAQMATSLATALGSNHLNSNISTSIANSEFVPSAGASKITFTKGTAGTGGNGTIDMIGGNDYAPSHTNFTGGRSGSAGITKSAADKVQDLYGILHNTDRGTAALLVGAAIGVAATVATGGTALVAAGIAGASAGGLLGGIESMFNGDYPIGLQIPYNSMITAENGQKYALRNFLIKTGLFTGVNEKIASGNDTSANVAFDTGDDSTGIQGTIQKLDIGYSAGEQHYTYQMVFAPIEMII